MMPNNRGWGRRWIAAACCTVLWSSLVATTTATAVAQAPPELDCEESAAVLRVPTNGDMLLYQHLEPETGAAVWQPRPPVIGRGWQNSRPVAAPGGVVYAAQQNGALRRYRWTGSAWQTFAGGAQHEVISGAGWERYVTAAYRNRLTVDSEGHIYTVEPDGWLHWRAYDTRTRTWTHRQITPGWEGFTMIVAAGPGVIYARRGDGALFRVQYHAESQRWLGPGEQVDDGWQNYDRVISPGADILYGIRPNGEMYWHRFDPMEGEWTAEAGRLIGRAWIDHATTAAPSSCTLDGGYPIPTRPVVPAQPMAPAALLYTEAGQVVYSYVDREGRAVQASLPEVSGAARLAFSAVPRFSPVTGTPSLVEQDNGTVHLVALGTDADVRGSAQATPNGAWSTAARLGGFLPHSPVTARLAGGRVFIAGLDESNRLWVRTQAGPLQPFVPWTEVDHTPLAGGRLTVVPTEAGGARLLGMGPGGTFHVATFEDDELGPWTSLGGTGFAGRVSAVAMPDGTLQVFANLNGVVHTQRETANGFTGTWTPMDMDTADPDVSVAVAGTPSAVEAPSGAIMVVVRGADGFLYYSGQVTPGAEEFTPWRDLTAGEERTGTDPTALAVPDENTWVVAYRTERDLPRLRRHAPVGAFPSIPLALPRR
ncbi:tachylectin-related carbohydrate-binding protein [Actinophytocola xanthii]|uniref:Tachylectin 2 domain-containing protein n=1 Tax=Actinophytocola xanthii TaxID=1912961 RepID=A0A1Q8CUU8_9PSEU|nr:tachylectin-related carbohydrate-binding protein [Actinophytocola xanthii]OLF18133.1 hypothetical protein BU204_08370 [Actinophytocola xanthii]